MAETRDYQLLKPIKMTLGTGDQARPHQIDKLVFRVPEDGLTAEDLLATDGHSGHLAMTLALASHFCGEPYRVLLKLKEPDVVAVAEIIEDFRKAGQLGGGD